MKDSMFRVECPCCGARMEIDRETGVVLTHERKRSAKAPTDLNAAVEKLKSEEAMRESVFDRKVTEQANRNKDLDKKFAGLLKRQKGVKPTRPDFREIDLD